MKAKKARRSPRKGKAKGPGRGGLQIITLDFTVADNFIVLIHTICSH
jgi:hypothetical protein